MGFETAREIASGAESMLMLPARRYLHALRTKPLRDKTVYYHAYRTGIMSCSPFALFRALLADGRFADFQHVWVYGDDRVLGYDTFRRYAGMPNVRFVKRGSAEQEEALATAKYLVTNAGFPDYWQKRPGQVVVNTWHGTPLKTLGVDARDYDPLSIGNAQRNFLLTDYLVMPNRYTAERIADSYCLHGLFGGEVLDVGAPRIDLVLNADRQRVRRLLGQRCGHSLAGKKVLLYAPTFRSQGGRSVNTSRVTAEIMSELIARAPQGYEVFFKVHNTLGDYYRGDSAMCERLVFDEVETNELLGAVDVLVTDYSSIFFDFICTGRPVLFLAYDRAEYEAQRGMYLDMDGLSGTVCASVDDVVSCLQRIESNDYENPNQEAGLARFAAHDDGRASERVVQAVFARDCTPAESPPMLVPDDASGDASSSNDVLVSLADDPGVLELAMLLDVLADLKERGLHATVATVAGHLVRAVCKRDFPEVRVVFADIESGSAYQPPQRSAAFCREQMDKYFPGMRFCAYCNMKFREGFVDEIVCGAIPDIPKYWRFVCDGQPRTVRCTQKAKRYVSAIGYCDDALTSPVCQAGGVEMRSAAELEQRTWQVRDALAGKGVAGRAKSMSVSAAASALARARALNRAGKHEECIAWCDEALLHIVRRGRRAATARATARLYAGKALARAIEHERARARAAVKSGKLPENADEGYSNPDVSDKD